MSRSCPLICAALALALAGCGATSRVAPPPTLSPQTLPYLPSSTKSVSAVGLAREAEAPVLAQRLSAWGYLAGADRVFQGESRQLQFVDSRAFRFRTAAGAGRFVTFVGAHAAAYLGSFPLARPFRSRGRSGVLVTAQPCQCHMANPAYLGVVSRGSIVTWLEINGPAATPGRLAALIATVG